MILGWNFRQAARGAFGWQACCPSNHTILQPSPVSTADLAQHLWQGGAMIASCVDVGETQAGAPPTGSQAKCIAQRKAKTPR